LFILRIVLECFIILDGCKNVIKTLWDDPTVCAKDFGLIVFPIMKQELKLRAIFIDFTSFLPVAARIELSHMM
jgi:hypothetical protein